MASTLHANGPAWGDEAVPAPVIDTFIPGKIEESGPDANGIRTITEYRRNPTTGAKEKVVRRIKHEVRVLRIPKVVEERAQWRRFGKAVSNEGTVARSYDDIKFELPGAEKAKDEVDKLLEAAAANQSVIVCRKCGAVGEHYTLKCPYKDMNAAALAAAGMTAPGGGGGGSGGADGGDGADGDIFGGGGAGGGGGAKYIPPSRRGVTGGGGGSGGGDAEIPESELTSLRISNLGEDVDEQQLRDLFRPFGHITRCFVATDRVTNAPKGFAFITFSTHDEAERARVGMHGYPVNHLVLSISWAKPNRGEGGGGGGLASSGFVSGYGKALPQNLRPGK